MQKARHTIADNATRTVYAHSAPHAHLPSPHRSRQYTYNAAPVTATRVRTHRLAGAAVDGRALICRPVAHLLVQEHTTAQMRGSSAHNNTVCMRRNALLLVPLDRIIQFAAANALCTRACTTLHRTTSNQLDTNCAGIQICTKFEDVAENRYISSLIVHASNHTHANVHNACATITHLLSHVGTVALLRTVNALTYVQATQARIDQCTRRFVRTQCSVHALYAAQKWECAVALNAPLHAAIY